MADWLRILLAVLVGAHGIGHILFLAPLLGLASWGQAGESWLLGSSWPIRAFGVVIYVAVILGFIAAAFGIFRETSWWQSVLLTSAVVSIVGLALFWVRPPTSPEVSAMAFNGIAIGLLFLMRWLPVAQAAR